MDHATLISELEASARGVFEAHDAEFAAVLGPAARLVRVVSTDAHEGPADVPSEDALYFTTLPRPTNLPAPGVPQVAIKRLALDVVHRPELRSSAELPARAATTCSCRTT